MAAPAPHLMQLLRLMRWAALCSLAFALAALLLLGRGESDGRAYNFIVTALGVGLGALLGVALLTLLYLGGRNGRDRSAIEHKEGRQ